MAELAVTHSLNEQFMAVALDAARRGLVAGEPPVGACLVKDGEIVVSLNNAVISELDITAHAEIRVIREACRRLRKLELSGCQLFVTVEPCPMCLSACHYAAIPEVIYGAQLADMHAVTGSELVLPQADSLVNHGHSIRLTGDCLRAECRALLEEWGGNSVAR
jgi:tRNA(Arg) A34 adenosine deaminase TadA